MTDTDRILMYTCAGCTAEYTTPLAAAECEEQHNAERRPWRCR